MSQTSQADDLLSPEMEAYLANAENILVQQQAQAQTSPAGGAAHAAAACAVQSSAAVHRPQPQPSARHSPYGTREGMPVQPLPGACSAPGRLAFPGCPPLPPPAAPPPPLPQPAPQSVKMAPCSQRTQFSNHRATKSVGMGVEAALGGRAVCGVAQAREEGSMAPRLGAGGLPQLADYDAYQKIACQIIGNEDRQKVAGKTFIKKSGCVLAMRMFARKLSPRAACSDVFCASSWRKLAMAFEISFEIRQCEIQYNDHGCEKLAA